MNTIAQTASYLANHDNFIIIPHRSPDGDCLGSSSALLLALRSLGKNARIALPTPATERLSFIWSSDYEQGDFEPEVAVAVDVADTYMMLGLYDEIFAKAKSTVCIDHHATNPAFANVNCIDATAAAAGEIVSEVIEAMGVTLNRDIAERLYVAIADDTGGFQYSNTTHRTHRIASKLFKSGIDSAGIMKALFATHTKAELELLKFVTARMEYHFGGKVCLSWVDSEALKASDAQMPNADAWIGLTRSGEGVEVGLMFKLIDDEEIRVSLRSNNYVDVSAVAKKFGGGGHVRAAGITFYESFESAKAKLLAELEKLV